MTLIATFLTLFPESLRSVVDASILGRAQKAGVLQVGSIDMREFSTNKHRTVDDSPAGGGAGMVLRVDVVVPAIRAALRRHPEAARPRVILLDARGPVFTQADARRLARMDHLVFVCGRYEGIDARAEASVDEVLSIGDYVLTGGELPALVVLDAVARMLPGVLGNEESALHESHADEALLEHRQYTRPVEFEGASVPPVLLAGNHKAIADARRKDALLMTRQRRPDLFVRRNRARADDKLLMDADLPSLDPVHSTTTDSQRHGA